MSIKKWGYVLGLLVGGGVVAGSLFRASDQDQHGATLRVVAGAAAAAGGQAMEFRLYRCGHHEPTQTVSVPFQGATVASFSHVAKLAMTTATPHHFARFSWQGQAGCYRVSARPVDALGKPVGRCQPATSPHAFVGAGDHQRYTLLAACPNPVGAGLTVAGGTNHRPKLAELVAQPVPSDADCDTIEVCGTGRDRDGDWLSMQWTVRSSSGRHLDLGRPTRTRRAGRLSECFRVSPGKGTWRVDATVRDHVGPPSRGSQTSDGPMTIEDAYLGKYGLVARSRDHQTMTVTTECNRAQCPDEPAKRVTDRTYWITRDGTLRAPTDTLADLREADTVDVEFDVAPGCQNTRVTFASYFGRDRGRPASVFSQTYGPGAHMLWNVLPACRFTADIFVGSHAQNGAVPGARPDQRHLLESVTGGTHRCPSN